LWLHSWSLAPQVDEEIATRYIGPHFIKLAAILVKVVEPGGIIVGDSGIPPCSGGFVSCPEKGLADTRCSVWDAIEVDTSEKA